MLERILAFFRNLFKRSESKPVAKEATIVAEKATPVLSLDTREGWDAWRNTFAASTRSFIPTWEEKVRRDSVVVDGPAVDRSGFELTEQNGYLVTPKLVNNTPYTFILGKPGTVKVFGVSGNQINKVNGQKVIYEAEIPNQSGSITLVVESVDQSLPVGVRIT